MEPPTWASWGSLEPAVRNGTVPFKDANGMMIFDYYAQHPESAQPFNEFMSFFSSGEIPIVQQMFDWSQYDGKVVMDIGGSLGPVPAAIKEAAPGIARCINFDLPEVIESISEPFPGVENVAGDMFDPSTLPKADCVFMKHILHD